FCTRPLTTPWISSLSLHDALPILLQGMDAILVPGGFGERGIEGKIQAVRFAREQRVPYLGLPRHADRDRRVRQARSRTLRCEQRSEEHTSELQSPCNLVCRLLLEK